MPLPSPLAVTDFQDILCVSTRGFFPSAPMNQARAANGTILRSSIGETVWRGSFQTDITVDRAEAGRLQALLSILDRAGASFLVYDPAKQYPADDPDGAALAGLTPSVRSFDLDDARLVALQGLPANFRLAAGDYVGWRTGRRNLIDHSEDLTQWNAITGASLPVSTGSTKAGFSDWFDYTFAGSNPSRLHSSGIPVFTGRVYTGSIYLDTTSAVISSTTEFDFYFGESDSFRIRVTVNTTDWSINSAQASIGGQFLDPVLLDYGREDVGNGVYRYWATLAPTRDDFYVIGVWEKGNTTAGDVIRLTGGQINEERLEAYQKVGDGSGLDQTRYMLHQVVRDVRTNSAGDTPLFEVTPFVQPTLDVGDAASLVRPKMEAVLAPDPNYGTVRGMVTSGTSLQFVQTLR